MADKKREADKYSLDSLDPKNLKKRVKFYTSYRLSPKYDGLVMDVNNEARFCSMDINFQDETSVEAFMDILKGLHYVDYLKVFDK